MPTSPIPPTALEYTCTFKFFGADLGKWPSVDPGNPVITMKINSAQFDQGTEFAEFTTTQDRTALNRLIKENPSMSFGTNIQIPSEFLDEFQQNGPLVLATITADNQLDGAGANLTLIMKGIMKLGAMDFLANPGNFSFELLAYGETPTLSQSGL
jgi:hypothetical protein